MSERDYSIDIAANLAVVQRRIDMACLKAGRNSNDVRLLLATKTVDPQTIKIALRTGYTLIAENKVQEIKAKFEALKEVPHENHFIGHLQSNKIAELLKYNILCIQSIDDFEKASRLNQRLIFERKTMRILVQVNTSGEVSKFGVHPDRAVELIRQIANLDAITVDGLMTIGLFSTDQDKVRACFKRLKQISHEVSLLEIPNVQMNELSMGMSNDLEIAIEEGATIVRVGTAIFGERPKPDGFYWNENAN
jgi:pyridoxal phosphate enzyme (YggS family)